MRHTNNLVRVRYMREYKKVQSRIYAVGLMRSLKPLSIRGLFRRESMGGSKSTQYIFRAFRSSHVFSLTKGLRSKR